MQSGHLRSYVFITVGTAVGLVGSALVAREAIAFDPAPLDVRWHELLIGAMIAAAAIATTLAKTRLAAIAFLGLAGYGVAVMFVMFGGPDLAMTQLAVETLTVVIFVLIFRRLPEFRTISTRLQRTADAFMAIAAGLLVSVLALLAARSTPDGALARWFGEQSYLEGHGRNVVNVILVDFRAIDTLGEITVLAIAAIGVLALLRPASMQGRRRSR